MSTQKNKNVEAVDGAPVDVTGSKRIINDSLKTNQTAGSELGHITDAGYLLVDMGRSGGRRSPTPTRANASSISTLNLPTYASDEVAL